VDDSPGAPANDNVATRLGGTLLDPVDVIAIELDLGEADDARDDRVSGDGRAPAAVRTGAHVKGHVLQATRCIPSPICGGGSGWGRSYTQRTWRQRSVISRTSIQARSSRLAPSPSARTISSPSPGSTIRSRCMSTPPRPPT